MTAATQPVTEEPPAAESDRPYPLPLSGPMRRDLHRRAGLATAEAGRRVTFAEIIYLALWPDGPPTE